MNALCPAIILASPRSGTTVLGQALGAHPDIADWYEPYFIWDYRLDQSDNDVRTVEQATPEVVRFVRREFELFQRKSGGAIIIEKTPRNAFKIDFIRTIFPEARWIHLYRDGRDVTCSIHREWCKRKHRNVYGRLSDVVATLRRQRYWRNRCQAILFELRSRQRSLSYLPSGRRNWNSIVGWGPRFPGWQRQRQESDELTFAAHQWIACEQAIEAGISRIDRTRVIRLRYEDLVREPGHHLRIVLDHIGASTSYADNLAAVFHNTSVNRSFQEMSEAEMNRIIPILRPRLSELGYI